MTRKELREKYEEQSGRKKPTSLAIYQDAYEDYIRWLEDELLQRQDTADIEQRVSDLEAKNSLMGNDVFIPENVPLKRHYLICDKCNTKSKIYHISGGKCYCTTCKMKNK